jgi:hypothetical protein
MNYPMPPVDFDELEKDALGSVKEELAESTVAEILKQGISLGMLLGKSYKKKEEADDEEEDEDEEEEEEGKEDDEMPEGCGHPSPKHDLVAMLLGRRGQGMFPMKPKSYQDPTGEPQMVPVDEKKRSKSSPMMVIAISPKKRKQGGFFG